MTSIYEGEGIATVEYVRDIIRDGTVAAETLRKQHLKGHESRAGWLRDQGLDFITPVDFLKELAAMTAWSVAVGAIIGDG
ncbi:hypothetical protein Bca101_079596 [Brassica carinata]